MRSAKSLLYLILSVVAGLLLFSYERVPLVHSVQLMFCILLFNFLLNKNRLWERALLVVMCFAYVALLANLGAGLVSQSVFLGMASEVASWNFKKGHMDRKLEVRRDVLHVVFGGLLMLFVYSEGANLGGFVLIAIALLGIAAITIAESTKNRMSKWLFNLEREGSHFGYGAIWLGIGAIVTIAFLPKPYIIAVFGALFLGDPMATLVGLSYPIIKLPYNKSKSLGGFAAYSLITFAVAYPIIGVYAVPLALVSALLESANLGIDDNLSVPLVLVLLVTIGRHLLAFI